MNFIFKRNYFNPPSSVLLKIYVEDEKREKQNIWIKQKWKAFL